MYVRCDESSLYSRINYVHIWRGTSGGVSGNKFETMHTGTKGLSYWYRANALRADEETDVMI